MALTLMDAEVKSDGRCAETGSPRAPHVCVPTARGFSKRVFQCAFYEAQDVLHEAADADLLVLEPALGLPFREKWQHRLMYRDISKRLVFLNPGLKKVRLKHEYDLLIVHCQNYWDFLYINAIDRWKDKCRTTVCWIDELWAANIPHYKNWLHALTRFDHVFVGYKGTAEPLSAALGKTCHWLPAGVDALRFAPYPNPPARRIDVYSMGRRWEGLHVALLQASRDDGLFYVYDTIPGVQLEVWDHAHHREFLASMAKRSRYFMVAPGKAAEPGETQGQVEIGYRYYEGAAAGAVLIGQAPDGGGFREMFPWEDVVIPVAPDGSDVMDVLRRLDADPERLDRISMRNTAEALLRHDWLYRWKEVFRVVGLEPSPGMQARERRLKELADLALAGKK